MTRSSGQGSRAWVSREGRLGISPVCRRRWSRSLGVYPRVVADMVRILRCCGATLAPSPPQPRFGIEPAGQDPGQAVTPGRRHYRSVRSRMPVLSATIFRAVFVRAGFGTCGLGLITVWLPVRVLPAPPRSPAFRDNSEEADRGAPSHDQPI
jgi:hypothetical protein